MNIVERVRRSINWTTNVFDPELRDDVEAARLALQMAGVPARVARDEDNAAVVHAIKTYVKSTQAWEDPAVAQAQKAAFDSEAISLAMAYGGDKPHV